MVVTLRGHVGITWDKFGILALGTILEMAEARILRGRIERWAAHYHGPRFHALLCDPPYELGFMGRDWDKSGVSFNPETWAALAEHLYPGAFGMVFASSRGWHRLACAIEDAGMVIHPTIWKYWSYGSGFPKASRLDTQVDAAAGAKRRVVGKIVQPGSTNPRIAMGNGWQKEPVITAPAPPLAAAWEGHRYGLQAIKPAVEPIIVFSKPYEGRPVESIVETGAGALWIDGGRIGTKWQGPTHGRWPANLCLVHHPECRRVGSRQVRGNGTSTSTSRQIYSGGWGSIKSVEYRDADGLETIDDWECHADCPARALGEQSGVTKSSGGLTPGVGAGDGRVYSFGNEVGANAGGLGDTGTAARFFFQADWALEQAEPVFYCAKASRAERDAGLSDMPLSVGHNIGTNACARCGRRVKHNGSGVGCECGAQRETIKLPTGRNPHPAVKPLTLCKWLATLLLPPQEYAPRRILVPFAGSGSEMIGALLAGWDWILGIEMLAENARLAEARLAWWTDKARWGQTNPAILLSEYEPDNGHEQLELF